MENFVKSASSINNNEPTRFQETYFKKYGNKIVPSKVKRFIREYLFTNCIDTTSKLETIATRWRAIESVFIKRANAIFRINSLTPSIHIYLTTNNRCTYNLKKKYFFVYIESKNTNHIIMHEFFHFYTWKVLSPNLRKNKISLSRYNDIKESLTEILNLEFPDMLKGAKDNGYPQHREIRNHIRNFWRKQPNMKKLLDSLL
ncbi:MAG: hypothetical protein ACYC49_00395 [Ignavibacteriaceae bacterium]